MRDEKVGHQSVPRMSQRPGGFGQREVFPRVSVHPDTLGRSTIHVEKAVGAIDIPADWSALIRNDVEKARSEQLRVRTEFKKAFGQGLVCAGFERGQEHSSYLLFERNDV